MAKLKVDNGKYADEIRNLIQASEKTFTRIAIDAGLTPEQLNDIVKNRRWLRAVEMDRIRAAAIS